MIADIGLVALILSFFVGPYITIVSFMDGRMKAQSLVESGRMRVWLPFALLTISVMALVYSLIRMDFSPAYVSDVTSRSMSTFLRITALWGGRRVRSFSEPG